jgi:hypothetical protein
MFVDPYLTSFSIIALNKVSTKPGAAHQRNRQVELSEDDLQLPIAVIWNHELLTQRLLGGWDPRQEGRAA